MKAIKALMEDQEVQTMLSEQKESIDKGTEVLYEFADVVQEHVIENLSQFIGESVADTHSNIAYFTEHAVASFADTLSQDLANAV